MSATTDRISCIATPRLCLRAPASGDVEAIVDALQDWELVRNLARVPWPYARGHAEEFLRQAETWRAEDDERTFAINDGAFCGMISIRGYREGEARLGYWLARPAWGKGYATEAARAIVDHAFQALGATSVNAAVVADNPASMRVLEKAGLTRRCSVTCSTLARGDQPATDFRLTRADWQQRQ